MSKCFTSDLTLSAEKPAVFACSWINRNQFLCCFASARISRFLLLRLGLLGLQHTRWPEGRLHAYTRRGGTGKAPSRQSISRVFVRLWKKLRQTNAHTYILVATSLKAAIHQVWLSGSATM